ncbi:MAG: hypothetical protein WC724_00665 [Candidatus Paceibacterota bacterium]|jgi:hypothetical protein
MQNRTIVTVSSTLVFDLEKKIEAYLKSHEWRRLIHPQLGDDFLVTLWSEGNVLGGLGKDGFVEIERNKIPGKKNITRAVSTRKAVENCLNGTIRVRALETHELVEVVQGWALLSIPDAVKAKVINHRTGEANNKAKQLKLRFQGKSGMVPGHASMEITGQSAS